MDRAAAMKPPCVLTIAGSDSGAGAGLQADSRTIHALGGYALTVVTAVTAQNSRGVRSWRGVGPELIANQIEAVMSDFAVGAIKTGLLPGGAAVRAIAAALNRYPPVPLVVDPVLGSTSGTAFLSPAGQLALLRGLLPRATLLTPNWVEAAALSGQPVRTFAEAEAAARVLLQRGCVAVLVKGGHAPGQRCRDVLVTHSGASRWSDRPRVQTRNSHGTGCVLSAAIATLLARGFVLERAVTRAQTFLHRSLVRHRAVRLGAGRGPALPW